MQAAPHTFVQLHKIAGLTEEKIEDTWTKVNELTGISFIQWLLTGNLLSGNQKIELQNKLTQRRPNSTELSLAQMLIDYLNKQNLGIAIQHYNLLFLTNLEKAYQNLKEKSSPEQNQVISSYLQTAHA